MAGLHDPGGPDWMEQDGGEECNMSTKFYFKFLRNDFTAGFADERWLGQGIWSEVKGPLSMGIAARIGYSTKPFGLLR